jgi:PTS system ascorbate-specific IIA component
MPGLLIIAHAPLASALKAVAEHTFPACGRTLAALDVTPQMSPEAAEEAARLLLGALGTRETLVFTDVFGATPCNAALRLADDPSRVRVVAGVNVPMLWRTLCYADPSLDAMVARAVAGATQGVMPVASSRPQNQATQPGTHGQGERHDQQ